MDKLQYSLRLYVSVSAWQYEFHVIHSHILVLRRLYASEIWILATSDNGLSQNPHQVIILTNTVITMPSYKV